MIRPVLKEVDLVLLMTVNPGFGGQAFIPEVLEKVTETAQFRRDHGLSYEIEVDGGVNERTARLCAEAGADVLVAGSAVFNQPDRKQAIEKIRASL